MDSFYNRHSGYNGIDRPMEPPLKKVLSDKSYQKHPCKKDEDGADPGKKMQNMGMVPCLVDRIHKRRDQSQKRI
jgi:hypothetical protein